MFKKNDYIVLLDKKKKGPEFIYNHIYKVFSNAQPSEYFRQEFTSSGYDSTCGYISRLKYNSKDNLWRYADRDEIAAYDYYKKPISADFFKPGDEVRPIGVVYNNKGKCPLLHKFTYIIEDVIYGKKLWIYFDGIPGIYEAKYFKKEEK